MASQILSVNNRVPGSYFQITFGAGAGSAGTGPRKLLVVGMQLAGSGFTVDEPIQVLSVEDAIAGLGQGSEGHRMVRAALAADPTLDLSVLPLADPGGVAATGIFTFTGTATESKTLTLHIANESVEFLVSDGDAFGAAAAACDTAAGDLDDAPATSGVAAGVVTLTARHTGVRGNDIRFRIAGTVAGITIVPSGTNLGSTTPGTGTDTLTTAQANLAAKRFHIYALPNTDLVTVQAWRDFIVTQAAADTGIRQAYIAPSVGTLGATTTFAQGSNSQRGQVVWLEDSPLEPPVMCATWAAIRTAEESLDPAAPMSEVHDTLIPSIPQPIAALAIPTPAEKVSALNNGISPIMFDDAANARILRSITSRSQNNAGSAPDLSTLDSAKQTVPDFTADDVNSQWPAFVLANPKLSPVELDPPVAGVATPSLARDWLLGILRDEEAAGILVDVEANEPLVVVEIAASPDGRLVATIPTDVIEGTYQFTGNVQQIG